jgi:hypothetical protein
VDAERCRVCRLPCALEGTYMARAVGALGDGSWK